MSNQFGLLKERRFAPFFGVQFLGALNDNVFKQALVILLTYSTARYTTMSTDILQNLAQALFVLPFFLFSATAGQLADKYEKSRLISITVAIELCCMALGAAGFFLHSLPLLFAALFLGGIQSALFGPVKYAILPQHLKEIRARRRQRHGGDGHLGGDPRRHDAGRLAGGAGGLGRHRGSGRHDGHFGDGLPALAPDPAGAGGRP
jgi:MFS family permease